MQDTILILDFGSQYTQLIARRVRECNVYCEIRPFAEAVNLEPHIKAVILSGSPASVTAKGAPEPNLDSFMGKVPVLGVCYGAQYLAQYYGGKVAKSDKREYGKAVLTDVLEADPIFGGITDKSQVWMSHGDSILELPSQFEVVARTESIPVAAFRAKSGSFDAPVYGFQFHPEVTHSLDGARIIKEFVCGVAAAKQEWTPGAFVDMTVAKLKEQVGDDHVIMGLSGGVDSTVGATLLHRAIGKQLICVFVDNGLLRYKEFEEVLAGYEGQGLNIIGVRAADRFLKELKGVTDPEQKRKIIGRVFIEVFEDESKKYPEVKHLGQGTIYPDVIESVSVNGPSVTIKSHHNVGGLPDRLKLSLVEPLRMLFKDEVREVGRELGLPDSLIDRHPFPGPGFGIRILGDITEAKTKMLQLADYIFITALKEFGLYNDVWQAAVILLPVQSVGVMGDERTYEQPVVLRAVSSRDGMTAEWSRLPHDFLAEVSSRIINNVKGINRVVYDISTKPPATIEWE